MSSATLSMSLIILALSSVDSDNLTIEKKPLIEMDPTTAEFEAGWTQVIEATCPNIHSQAELADVVTLRYLILTYDYIALSENAVYITSIWDEALKIEANPNSTALEKTAAKKLRDDTLRPILERFQNEINRVIDRMETVEYDSVVLSEERSGTEVTTEQIQIRCTHELATSRRDILHAHDFIIGELKAIETPLLEYYQNTLYIRCSLGLTDKCPSSVNEPE